MRPGEPIHPLDMASSHLRQIFLRLCFVLFLQHSSRRLHATLYRSERLTSTRTDIPTRPACGIGGAAYVFFVRE
ncbi:hypothetical protein [Rhizobium sp. Root1203]|uniref:hypothetical protein n=1 Tax=Rhizobium sp. Root1203 TaxID=1736427 RepID=UPI000ADA2F58|nr:hypothetical protein [Rhizobium sp. Root1203]